MCKLWRNIPILSPSLHPNNVEYVSRILSDGCTIYVHLYVQIRSFWLLLLFLLIFTRTFLLAAINVSYRYDLKSYIKLFLSTVEHVGISDERSSKYVTKELNLHKFVMTLYHACTISITGWIWYDRSRLKQTHHHLLHNLARMIIHWGWENISNDVIWFHIFEG